MRKAYKGVRSETDQTASSIRSLAPETQIGTRTGKDRRIKERPSYRGRSKLHRIAKRSSAPGRVRTHESIAFSRRIFTATIKIRTLRICLSHGL